MVPGIDLSHWQSSTPPLGTLSFVWVRLTVGTATDDKAAMHIANARAAGLPVFGYHFAYGDISLPAQISAFTAAAKGWGIEIGAMDIEGTRQPSQSQTATLIAGAKAAGLRCGLYRSDSVFFNAGQDFNWVAKWSSTQPARAWTFWQDSDSYTESAYSGRLDHDWFNGTDADFAAWQAIPLAGDTVNTYPVPKTPSVCDIAKGVVLYTSDALVATDPNRIIIDPGRAMPYLGAPSSTVRIVEYVGSDGTPSGKAYFIHAADAQNVRAVTDPTPYSKADLDAAVAAAIAALPADTTPFSQADIDAAVAKALASLPPDTTPFSQTDVDNAVAAATLALQRTLDDAASAARTLTSLASLPTAGGTTSGTTAGVA